MKVPLDKDIMKRKLWIWLQIRVPLAICMEGQITVPLIPVREVTYNNPVRAPNTSSQKLIRACLAWTSWTEESPSLHHVVFW